MVLVMVIDLRIPPPKYYVLCSCSILPPVIYIHTPLPPLPHPAGETRLHRRHLRLRIVSGAAEADVRPVRQDLRAIGGECGGGTDRDRCMCVVRERARSLLTDLNYAWYGWIRAHCGRERKYMRRYIRVHVHMTHIHLVVARVHGLAIILQKSVPSSAPS